MLENIYGKQLYSSNALFQNTDNVVQKIFNVLNTLFFSSKLKMLDI